MSSGGKDGWHPAPPAPSDQPLQQQQAATTGPPGPSGLPGHQQGPPHSQLPQGGYRTGQPPPPSAPVQLPPPREMSGASSAYYSSSSHPHNPASHPHSLPQLPGISSTSHSSYPLPGISSSSGSTYGPQSSGGQQLPQGPPQSQPSATQRDQPPPPQSQSSRPPVPPQQQTPQRPGMPSASPPTVAASSTAMHGSPSIPNQQQQQQQPAGLAAQQNQGGDPAQVAQTLMIQRAAQEQQRQQQQQQAHQLHALSGLPQGPSQSMGGPGGTGASGAPGQAPAPGGQGPANGPGGPILNDALSYLDQVKFQFQDQPDVYNKFLDIMKDFKSQAIDTPGVIDRVSTLFSGHPSLIQGFNTFLPPGYRIECSTDPGDTKITVTTPNGIHTAASGDAVSIAGNQGMPLPQAGIPAASAPGQAPRYYEQQPQPQRWSSVEGVYGPYNQVQTPGQQEAIEIARQQQMAVQAQAQAQAAQQQRIQTNGAGPKVGPPGPGTPGAGERGKGPVEFNHAISYVNKIKNRFSHQPEIYKNFLEILQTYQRESKPIQDVYSQVTRLFQEAPDLLEDFKQFLPESAAQARAAAAAKAAQEETQNGGPPGSAGASGATATRLPAVGTFPPPPAVSKKGAAKRQQAAPHVDLKADQQQRPGATKRAKVTHHKPTIEQQIESVGPSLTPFNPEPLGPPPLPSATNEELSFFDRVKKFIGNKQTYNEFLKLLNLFSQGLIDKAILVEKVHNFIGGNPELMKWFKQFMQWDGKEDTVENTPKLMNKVRLSVCRALGPSYRLLPRLESQKPCSGRDEMCWEVLNDHWASHPTWASEDSGFVAHKKNQYEEILHRIEEERHDYDFNIEANLRTIQLLEPIAQRIANMSQEEKNSFKLPPGLGGQSTTIYQRIIKKVYDREKGQEVIDHLHNNPAQTVPIVLKRLKQKDEEWKSAQREWQKVWRDQTIRAFWKSLDHQGIAIKTTDKKAISHKALVAEIQAKFKEQTAKRLSPTTPPPAYQFRYMFEDPEIIFDAIRLLLTGLDHNSSYSMGDREKIEGFVKSFIPLFFGLDGAKAQAQRKHHDDDEGEDSVMEDAPSPRSATGATTPAVGSNTRRAHHRLDTQDLLRDVLKRHKKGSRKDKEGSIHSRGSRDSSQEVHDPHGDVDMTSPSSDNTRSTKDESVWISRPHKHDSTGAPISPAMDQDQSQFPRKRTAYTLFCNSTLYAFFRLLQLLCSRLTDVKAQEDQVRHDVNIRKQQKVADLLNISGQKVTDIFADTSDSAQYYPQILDMCERFIEGDMDSQAFEESLRNVVIHAGWKLYTVDRLVNAILKFVHQIVPSDAKERNQEKEKNADMVLRFQKDRMRTEVGGAGGEKGEFQELMVYRKAVEGILGPDEPLYRIDWHEDTSALTIRLLPRDTPTIAADVLDKHQKWEYYIQSYMLTSPTEGIQYDRLRKVVLARNLPSSDVHHTPRHLLHQTTNPPSPTTAATPHDALDPSAAAQEQISRVSELYIQENMQVRICVNTFRMFFHPHTEDYMVRRPLPAVRGAESRRKRWEEIKKGLGWRKDATEKDVEKAQKRWEASLKGVDYVEEDGDGDVAMGGESEKGGEKPAEKSADGKGEAKTEKEGAKEVTGKEDVEATAEAKKEPTEKDDDGDAVMEG